MKTFVKSSGTLHSGNKSFLKIFSSIPSSLSSIADGEVVLVENDTFYQKRNGSLNPLGQQGKINIGSVGDIIAYYGTTNPDPDNLLICNGGTFSSTTYPELYTLLGTNTLPNLVGYHLKGTGSNSNFSNHDAISLNTKVSNNIGNHTHSTSGGAHSHSANSGSHYHTLDSCSIYGFGDGECIYCPATVCVGSGYNCCYCITTCNATPSLSICCTKPSITMSCIPTTTTSYTTVRYGDETKQKDKTILFLIRAK